MFDYAPLVELMTAIVALATAVVGLVQVCAQRPKRKKKNRKR